MEISKVSCFFTLVQSITWVPYRYPSFNDILEKWRGNSIDSTCARAEVQAHINFLESKIEQEKVKKPGLQKTHGTIH